MMVKMIGIWVVRTFGVYLFAWKLGFGLPAVWISIVADNALRVLKSNNFFSSFYSLHTFFTFLFYD
jgi:Na+-driven multidrug efflux pump